MQSDSTLIISRSCLYTCFEVLYILRLDGCQVQGNLVIDHWQPCYIYSMGFKTGGIGRIPGDTIIGLIGQCQVISKDIFFASFRISLIDIDSILNPCKVTFSAVVPL